MKFDRDDFELFGLPRRFAIDREQLDAHWRAVQAEIHPDRFAAEGASAQRVAMQWAVRVNGAYRRLKDPLQRAAYLCELNAAPIDEERNTSMPVEFLTQQMAWREALDDAHSADEVAALAREVAAQRDTALARLEETLDAEHDFPGAAQHVRALMFVERFADDVDRRLETLER